jgi:sugar/nucleoside kinase (ribokinase family)
MSRSGIILAGTVILDIVHMIDRWPDQDSVAMVQRSEYGAGGPPHNAAAGLKKLGAPFPVTLIGAVGDDAYGDTLKQQAQGYGLDTSAIVTVPGAITSHTQVMTVIPTGRRTFFHQVGVNGTLTANQLLPPAENAKIFYLGSPGIAKTMDHTNGWSVALKHARAQGLQTALELVPVTSDIIERLVPTLLPDVDILIVNDSEAEAITGLKLTHGQAFDWSAAEAACQELLALGVGDVAAIHHPAGAVAARRSGETIRAASVNVSQTEIVGTVGAGDAFYAGMLFGLHEDWSMPKCLALANACAATSLHSATTSASIRTAAECLSYAEARGLRDVDGF